MTVDIGFDAWMMGLSLAVVLFSYLLICATDRSWLNWASSGYVFGFAAIFLFPSITLFTDGPVGSRYGYFYCYLTYAITYLFTAVAYWLTLRIPSKQPAQQDRVPALRYLPWFLLILGMLLYAPIVIRFFPLLLHPREIYSQTRSGYGPLFYGSTAFLNLAFIVYLFKPGKRLAGTGIFLFLYVAFLFFHGSKGLLVNFLAMAMLYQVYVKGRRFGFAKAATAAAALAIVLLSVFALFANISDMADLMENIRGYADYTKNAMLVIDDPARKPMWGQLLLEGEINARAPRFLFPSKPYDLGIFKLAEYYYPAEFRTDTGNPDFGIGMQYADFGPLAIVYIGITSLLTGILVGFTVRTLKKKPTAPIFILLLFFSGVPLIAFGSGYPLPENMVLAFIVWFASRSPQSLLESPEQPSLPQPAR